MLVIPVQGSQQGCRSVCILRLKVHGRFSISICGWQLRFPVTKNKNKSFGFRDRGRAALIPNILKVDPFSKMFPLGWEAWGSPRCGCEGVHLCLFWNFFQCCSVTICSIFTWILSFGCSASHCCVPWQKDKKLEIPKNSFCTFLDLQQKHF